MTEELPKSDEKLLWFYDSKSLTFLHIVYYIILILGSRTGTEPERTGTVKFLETGIKPKPESFFNEEPEPNHKP